MTAATTDVLPDLPTDAPEAPLVLPAVDAWTRTLGILALGVRDPRDVLDVDPTLVAPGAPRELLRVMLERPDLVALLGIVGACQQLGSPAAWLAAWFEDVEPWGFDVACMKGRRAVRAAEARRWEKAEQRHRQSWDAQLAAAAAARGGQP